MVLTHSMATTTNCQSDEPRIAALKRQVQTHAVVVEHPTKQNHDLEKQLCQKNIGLNTQEEDQKGISAERKDQEGPERQDTNRLSTADIAPPHIVTEIQMIKDEWTS